MKKSPKISYINWSIQSLETRHLLSNTPTATLPIPADSTSDSFDDQSTDDRSFFQNTALSFKISTTASLIIFAGIGAYYHKPGDSTYSQLILGTSIVSGVTTTMGCISDIFHAIEKGVFDHAITYTYFGSLTGGLIGFLASGITAYITPPKNIHASTTLYTFSLASLGGFAGATSGLIQDAKTFFTTEA